MKEKFFRLNPAEEKAASIYEQKSLLDRNCSDKEDEIRQRYAESCPIEEMQRYIIKTNNVLAISVISENWDFDTDVVKYLIRRGTLELRDAYTANRKFFKSLEVEYAKNCHLPELRVYFSRYKELMDKKAYNICVDVRGIPSSSSYVKENNVAKAVVGKSEIARAAVRKKLFQENVQEVVQKKKQTPFGHIGEDGTFYM